MGNCSIDTEHALKLIGHMEKEELIKPGWGNHIQSFVALYNTLAVQDDFSDLSMEREVLKLLRAHIGQQRETFSKMVSANGDLQPFQDKLDSMIQKIDDRLAQQA